MIYVVKPGDTVDQIALNNNIAVESIIYDNQIPMRIKAAETAARGVSIFAYEPNNDVAKAYAGLAKEVIHDAEREKAKVRAEQCR